MNAIERELILASLKLGLYILTRDVTNPHPDRRMTRDWRAAVVIKCGTKLAIRERHVDGYDEKPDRMRKVIVKAGGWEYGEEASFELLDAILESGSLVKFQPETAHDTLVEEEMLNRGTDWTVEAFEVLVAAGKVNLDDVRAAARAIRRAQKEAPEGCDETLFAAGLVKGAAS